MAGLVVQSFIVFPLVPLSRAPRLLIHIGKLDQCSLTVLVRFPTMAIRGRFQGVLRRVLITLYGHLVKIGAPGLRRPIIDRANGFGRLCVLTKALLVVANVVGVHNRLILFSRGDVNRRIVGPLIPYVVFTSVPCGCFRVSIAILRAARVLLRVPDDKVGIPKAFLGQVICLSVA